MRLPSASAVLAKYLHAGSAKTAHKVNITPVYQQHANIVTVSMLACTRYHLAFKGNTLTITLAYYSTP